jgi:hypothetical protein
MAVVDGKSSSKGLDRSKGSLLCSEGTFTTVRWDGGSMMGKLQGRLVGVCGSTDVMSRITAYNADTGVEFELNEGRIRIVRTLLQIRLQLTVVAQV